jgi:hypothetical protein
MSGVAHCAGIGVDILVTVAAILAGFFFKIRGDWFEVVAGYDRCLFLLSLNELFSHSCLLPFKMFL